MTNLLAFCKFKEQASDAVCKQMHDLSMNESQVALNRVFHNSGVF